MIIIKAGPDLEETFSKMLRQFKRDIKWKGLFLINNNSIVLYGESYSLCFNFDNKKIFMDIVKTEVREENAIDARKNYQLSNVINIILYVFGKWNLLKGLNVKQKYSQLNDMFNNIFGKYNIESNLSDENLRFFNSGIPVTYEDVINKIVKETMPDEISEEESLDTEEKKEKKPVKKSKSNIGLWHDMIWELKKMEFGSKDIQFQTGIFGKIARRVEIGKNFAKVRYTCPDCNEHLHIVVFPPKTDVIIKTSDDRIYMTRAFACNKCKEFFTAVPQKLLNEGEIYYLNLSEDIQAYEDYLELLGEKGYMGGNSGFNEYESQRNRKTEENQEKSQEKLNLLEKNITDIDNMTKEEISELVEKMETGFFPSSEVKKHKNKIDISLKNKYENAMKSIQMLKEPELVSLKKLIKKEIVLKEKEKKSYIGKIDKQIKKENPQFNDNMSAGNKTEKDKTEENKIEEHKIEEHKTKKSEIKNKKSRFVIKKKNKTKNIILSEKELLEEAKSCNGKNYFQIRDLIEKIENTSINNIKIKEEVIKRLNDYKHKRGEKEIESIIEKIPEKPGKEEINLVRKKIDLYGEEFAEAQKELDRIIDKKEKRQIDEIIKNGKINDRKSLHNVFEKLIKENFESRNINPFLERIEERLEKADQEYIKKVCPKVEVSDFEEGIDLYKNVADIIMLPKFKIEKLREIEDRLAKIKTEENRLLVEKIKKELEEKIKDKNRLYYYDAEEMYEKEPEDIEAVIINNAQKTYGEICHKYELPIIVHDTSRKRNGKKGFILTEDHLITNTSLVSEANNVRDINDIYLQKRFLKKRIVMEHAVKGEINIPVSLNEEDVEPFSEILMEFIGYLKEKPESRNIEYLRKEIHEIQICFRCGTKYKGEGLCPNCGSQNNIIKEI